MAGRLFTSEALPPRPLTWGAPFGPLELPGPVPHLWLADAAVAPDVVERLAADVLDQRERRRADALRRTSDRRCYLTAHVALRMLLGAQLGTTPGRVRFRREPCPCCGGPHGRPAADPEVPLPPETPLHFSLSHSGDLALLAFAATAVGVDVQTTGSPATVEEMRGVLHPREQEELASCADADRPDAFSRAWVRKEAYLKGLGTGLARSPALDYLGTGAASVTSPPGWRVYDVEVPHGYAAALAARQRAAGSGAR
ncbi:4'-phosphopantetheinyl transferase family protein [Streptomyces sp. O3]